MNNKNYIIKSITQLGVAIEYLTWSLEGETYEDQIEWLDKAIKKMEDAKYWIDKSNILPF